MKLLIHHLSKTFPSKHSAADSVRFGLTESQKNQTVLSDLTLELSSPDIYCLMAPSGTGKTTLFRLILGLETPDSGTISFETSQGIPLPFEKVRFSAVFQENRIFEEFSPIQNLSLILGKTFTEDQLINEMKKLLPPDCFHRPASTLSGGMKRRLALLRAVLFPSDLLILDEPFSGLDDRTKETAISFLLEHQNDRLVLFSSHDTTDIQKTGGKLLYLDSGYQTPL